jgi:hypothetical protein
VTLRKGKSFTCLYIFHLDLCRERRMGIMMFTSDNALSPIGLAVLDTLLPGRLSPCTLLSGYIPLNKQDFRRTSIVFDASYSRERKPTNEHENLII